MSTGWPLTLGSLPAAPAPSGRWMLLYLYPRRMTPSRLVGADIVHAIPLTLLAGAGHLAMGNVDFRLPRLPLLGSIPGVLLGSLISTKVPRGLLPRCRSQVASKLLLS
jgi:uncharacterized membrane protein YfcA